VAHAGDERAGKNRLNHGGRADIQGMRGLAVIAVVLYHAGFNFISGGFVGVDFFFVLSGFLIIGLLIREAETAGRVSLTHFWARRARRLIPASATVIVATMIAAGTMLPYLQRKPVSIDAIWATFFGANWRFAEQQTNYLDSDRDLSPFQHFWSLGVEEQFYVVAPLVVVAVVWAARRRNVATRVLLASVLGAVALSSFAYCVYLSAHNQPYAFFGTHTRAWQLAAGGLLACATPALLAWGRRASATASVVGLGLLIVSVTALSEGGQIAGLSYPSALAVLPTAAAVLLLAGGISAAGQASAVSRLLSVRPLTAVGDISYSLYLWHWPVFVIGRSSFEGSGIDFTLVLIAISVILAVATYALIENPIRRSAVLSRSWRPAASTLAGGALLALTVPLTVAIGNQTYQIEDPPGIQPSDSVQGMQPPVYDVPNDTDEIVEIGCGREREDASVPSVQDCTWGDGPRHAYLLGDSIAAATSPGFIKAATAQRWRITVWSKSSCVIGDLRSRFNGMPDEFGECQQWRDDVIGQVIKAKPDLVVLAASAGSLTRLYAHQDGSKFTGRADKRREAIAGLSRTVRKFKRAGIEVAIVDSPARAPFNVPECLLEKRAVSDCTWPRAAEKSIMSTVAKRQKSHLIPLPDQYCSATTCQPVVGSTVTVHDKVHPSKTFVEHLTPMFERALRLAEKRLHPRTSD
jgi:peptidoglycan/LPS O-acetylase OafA/YrhL